MSREGSYGMMQLNLVYCYLCKQPSRGDHLLISANVDNIGRWVQTGQTELGDATLLLRSRKVDGAVWGNTSDHVLPHFVQAITSACWRRCKADLMSYGATYRDVEAQLHS